MSEQEQALERYVEQLFEAISKCFDTRLILPGLILLYSAIDIMASLDRPENKPDVTRDDFITWVDEFVLTGKPFSCEGIDLYAARCGLLHSYLPESKLTREGKARIISYSWGTAKAEDLQATINSLGRSEVAVHVNDLFEALRSGFERFKDALRGDPERAGKVYGRVAQFFDPLSMDIVEIALDVIRSSKKD